MIFKQCVLVEINLDSNTMFIKLTFVLLFLINQSKSWNLDFKNCSKKRLTYNTVCAVLYSSKYCHYNQWSYPFIILSKVGQKIVIPSHKRKSGFQSLLVKKGCGLKVFDNKRCLGTVFENHIKSLIYHCELRLHFEWTKVVENARNGPFWRIFEKRKLADKQCYQTYQF